MARTRNARCALLVLTLGFGAGACEERPNHALVFAAGALEPVVADLAARAEAAGARWTTEVGPGPSLAAKIKRGARPDVFLAASKRQADGVSEAGYGEPEALARGRLVVVTPRAKEKQVRGIRDLGREGVRVVLGKPSVSVGLHARVALARAKVNASPRVVSLEESAAALLAKLASGEADAAVVYATDVDRYEGDDLVALAIDDGWQPPISFWLVAQRPLRPMGRAALELLRSDVAKEALKAHAFEVPLKRKAPPPPPPSAQAPGSPR